MASANLDLLRSLAVLMVVAHHTSVSFGLAPDWMSRGGLMGVYLFFVHTSLVLMLSLQRTPGTMLGRTWRFYVRRFFRIYPLSVATVGVLVISRLVVGTTLPDLSTILSHLALTMNLTGAELMMITLWTLPLEVQMYVFMPGIFALTAWMTEATVVLLWGAAVGFALWQSHVHFMLWRGQLFQYVPHFLPGILAFVTSQRGQRGPRAWAAAGWLPALAACCIVAGLVNSKIGYWVLALVIGMLIPRFKEVTHPLLVRLGHNVATYSYGIYLLHTPAIWLMLALPLPPLVRLALCLLATTVFSVAAYHLIERPMIRSGNELVSGMGRDGARARA